MAILGVTDHRWLDYPDGGCAGVDPDEARGPHRGDHRRGAARHRAHVRSRRPDRPPRPHRGERLDDARRRRVPAPAPALYFATNTPKWVARVRGVGGRDGRDDGRRVEFPCTPRRRARDPRGARRRAARPQGTRHVRAGDTGARPARAQWAPTSTATCSARRSFRRP